MSYVCGPADWIDLAVGRLEDAKRSLGAGKVQGEGGRMKRAIRWVPARSEYRDWHVPDGASVSAADFSTAVECAECGCRLAFGESYTSRLIHNDLGFGYAVCPRCYEAEFREMGESCDL